MNFWLTLVGYQAVWFCAVLGAARGLAWPGVLAMLLFAAWRLLVSKRRSVDLRLAAVSLLLGLLMETVWVYAGLIHYAAAWPHACAPVWILALWLAFALTIVPLFGYLHARPWLAALFGAVGGPLAYAAAGRLGALAYAAPWWLAFGAIAAGWGLALPVLALLAQRWLRADHAAVLPSTRGTA